MTLGEMMVDFKPSEPEPESYFDCKFDDGKLRFDLIPPRASKALAQVLTYGAKKYAPESWRQVPDGKERYLAALYRHLNAYQCGELLDCESGISHLTHALCNAAFLVELEALENEKSKEVKPGILYNDSGVQEFYNA